MSDQQLEGDPVPTASRSPFKRILMWLGGLMLALMLLLGGCFAYLFVAAQGLDEESKAYVDAAVPAIISHWDASELKSRATPELIDAVASGGGGVDENISKLFTMYRRLGDFVSYDGSKGQAWVNVDVAKGRQVSARYVSNVGFSSGPAQVRITLLKRDGQWGIAGFYVDSKAFLEE